MTDSERELLGIFQTEATDYLTALNDALLKVEMAEGAEKLALLREMNRVAHSLKGAARAVGLGLIETIGHYMEEVFDHALNKGMVLTPEMADALYDGLDLIQNTMDGSSDDEALIAEVISNLEQIVALHSQSLQQNSPAAPKTVKQPEPSKKNARSASVPAPDEESDTSLMTIFWEEVSEHLSNLNTALLDVEMRDGAEKQALLREMNRAAHSLKGAARAVGLQVVEKISHYLEEIFSAAQQDTLALTPDLADTLYDSLDIIQNIMDGEALDPETLQMVLQHLSEAMPPPDSKEKQSQASQVTEMPAVRVDVPRITQTQTRLELGEASAPNVMRPIEETLRVSVGKLDKLMAEASELLVSRMQGEVRIRRIAEMRRNHARWQREWRGVRAAYIRLVRRMQEQGSSIPAEIGLIFKFLESNQRFLADSNRDLAQLAQFAAQENMHLATLADQLQDDVSDLRMMPFESIVSGFQRMVRDIARDVNKQLQLEISGAHVEIDKTVLDALKDPLMHLLRNAIDHGLEYPEERQALGKPPMGRISVMVEQRGSEILIKVQDDGRGVDVARVRRKAIERGLLSEPEANALPDEEARLLIFHSGFSTIDEVTALSGRGLGMDIVRERVENLRGRVSLQSSSGEGSLITLSVPVSLTRIRCILLRIGDEEYAMPSVMVSRMETISRDMTFTAEGQTMVNVGERPMPLVVLGDVLDIPSSSNRGKEVTILALATADRAVAFEVDQLLSEMELVLKPLGTELANTPCVAGAALMGSGDIMIVLDANDLVRKASGSVLPARRRSSPRNTQPGRQRRLRVLVVDDSITTRTLEKNILEAVGFEVHVAIDGVEAWTMLAEVAPDVIISDVEMPNMNGLELARKVKSHAQLREIPLILLTSLGKPEQREEGLRAGADAYLVKTRFDQGELLETIQSVL